MAEYRIDIRETVEKTVLVNADTKEKAFTGIRRKFDNGEIVLDKEKDSYDFYLTGNKVK